MEFYFFYTEVTWCWWENNVRKKAHESVIVFAQSHSHAAGILEENYGDELFSIDKIEMIGESNILPLSIAAGHALRDAAINYGKAEVIEEKDYSQKMTDTPPEAMIIQYYEDNHAERTPLEGKPIDSTYAQNWEGIAP